MGKSVQKRKGKHNGKLVRIYLLVVVPITLIFILLFYFVIQGIAERLGLSPIIILGISENSWMSSGEAVLMFVIWLSLSIVLGSIFAYLLVRKVAGR